MRFVCLLAVGVFTVSATSAFAQTTREDVCDVTAVVVTKAQEMRVEGKTSKRAVRTLTKEYSDRSEAFRTQAIPMLVNDYVYAQPESVLDQDLSAAWKVTCLATDLSSVLGTE